MKSEPREPLRDNVLFKHIQKLSFDKLDEIGTETLIQNSAGRFAVDVLIVCAMIAAAEAIVRLLSKALEKE